MFYMTVGAQHEIQNTGAWSKLVHRIRRDRVQPTESVRPRYGYDRPVGKINPAVAFGQQALLTKGIPVVPRHTLIRRVGRRWTGTGKVTERTNVGGHTESNRLRANLLPTSTLGAWNWGAIHAVAVERYMRNVRHKASL